MLVRKHSPGVLRELGEHQIFLGGEMDLSPVLEDCPLEQVDRDMTRLDRLLVGCRLELEKVRHISFEPARFGAYGRQRSLLARPISPELAYRARDRGDARSKILADRGKQD